MRSTAPSLISLVAGTSFGFAALGTCFLIGDIMRSCLLWLIGVPIPIIILLWLVTGHA